MQTLVMAILSLVVLVILIFVFRDQIEKSMQGYTDIAEESEKAAQGDTCGALFSDTRCINAEKSCEGEGDGWSKSSLTCVGSKTCCEKG